VHETGLLDFTALHGMQTRSSDEISVCLYVCPSVYRSVRLSKASIVTKREKNQCIFLYNTRDHFNLVFWEQEWLLGATASTWNFGSTGPRWSEIADFEQIIARSASAVTPNKKSSINTNRKSTTRFPMNVLGDWFPKGGLKTQNGRFSSKIALLLKKVSYKVSLCGNCQRQTCSAFIGLTIHAKNIGGATPSN